VKVLRSEYTGDPTFRARFRAEALHSAGLLHPNIATLFDYGEVLPGAGEQLAYLVMELVRGESLSALLAREPRLSPGRTLEILRQSAAGLAAAHAASVVHRDVKPGNVLLADDGTVKLTDFGVAVSAASVPLTGSHEVIGTANYLSPEQAQGHRATPASDVYALGLVGYECLTGRRGFDGESSVQIALRQIDESPPPLPGDVPEPVRRLIERAIAKDPAVRFADGATFRAAIDDVLAGRPIGATAPRTAVLPVAIPRHPTRVFSLLEGDQPERRRRWSLVLAALLTLVVVSGGTYGVLELASRRTDAAAAAGTPAVQPVSLTAADYVGRPVDAVRAELTGRGLQVSLRPLQTSDVADGSVIALDPVGQVPPGTVVTVTHAVAPTPGVPVPLPVPLPTGVPGLSDNPWLEWAQQNGATWAVPQGNG
jgi:serine/threonine-protein kinase